MTLTTETVRTPRLTLLPLAVAHAEEMAGVLGDPALHTFIGGTPPTLPELRARYERQTAGSPEAGVSWCNWVVRLDDESRLVGTVQATVRAPDPATDPAGDPVARHGAGTAEVAWVVGTPWQGRGIATEAVRGMIGLLTAHGVRTFVAHIHPGHAASAAVATAVGLTPTDVWHEGEVRWRLDTTSSRNPL
ncbi:GNAT family N-acetyltransferase [Streptomyces sp. Je 1-79]|uniref:GNAT family N-acetyltransferase n=1 Tax=Streptomyces sp. Je 1-79 TaxID=2943847 RepID=UPI0021A49CDD|nr:GNAT family N-acetyltransferase [Streptomyces sp. Je 1-79]MCT4356510.1 GNAT family N-acetyltransferase [Streptomyces sp. Je 1-79]